ncbi:MAG: hypothetical protein JWM16_250 [Verrucomicrobiales bacterium]|nr:hypothetical protein [Verrucomicrobiales bacterium]
MKLKPDVSLSSLLSVGLTTLILQMAVLEANAADLYIAPNGTPAGPGTTNQPYSLATALSGSVGAPGDTFWLRGGTYKLGHIDTRIQGAAGKPITFRQMPGESARVDGSITFFESQGYVTLWGFELFSSNPNHISQNSGQGMTPADLDLKSGLFIFVPNLNLINLVIHDHVRHGIYMSEQAINSVVHGCIVYNNGWEGPDMGDGHSFYIQSTGGTVELSDNMGFNGAANNFQVYTDHPGAVLSNLRMDGNIAFNAGISSTANSRQYRNFIVGVDVPAARADQITFANNMSYYLPGSRSLPQVQIGRGAVNGTVAVTDNYLPVGLVFNNWQSVIVRSNLIAPQNNDFIVSLKKDLVSPAGVWDSNTYGRPATGNIFAINSQGKDFPLWKTGTGFDAHSSSVPGALTGTKVIIRANQFETGRAHIVVYNWDKLSTVPADLSSVLRVGTPFEIRNAQNYFGSPVLTGTYTGQPLQLPMSGLTVAKPNAGWATPPPTGPQFNVFVVIPLGKTPVQNPPSAPPVLRSFLAPNSKLVLAWPTNAAGFTLQTQTGTSSSNNWLDVPAAPARIGDSFMLTNPISFGMKLYRLIKN